MEETSPLLPPGKTLHHLHLLFNLVVLDGVIVLLPTDGKVQLWSECLHCAI